MKKITLLMLCIFSSIIAQAQWNTDLAVNTQVANSNYNDTQSVVGANGDTYIVFWRNVGAPTNIELRIQKLDATGNKQFGSDGMLVSNTIPMQTSTAQWFVSIDANDNIYVGVTGTSGGGGFAFKVDSNGDNQWSNEGIDLGGVGYVVRVTPLSNGEVLISWLDDTFSGHIQKFSSAGAPIWANSIDLGSNKIAAQSFELSNGDFINIFHEKLSNFGVTSKMLVQRYDSNGNAIWASATELFATGNNTAYNSDYSTLQDDDVIYISYKLAHDNRFDAYVQRINPDGTLPWGITGMDFDTNQTNYEQENKIALGTHNPYIYMLCRYTDPSQGQNGAYLQKFDKDTGARQLTDNAKEIYPLSSGDVNITGDFRLINGQPIFLTTGASNSLNINLLDENGDFVWASHSKPFATSTTVKGRINLYALSNSEMVGTFAEDRGTGFELYAQNFTDAALLSVNDFEVTNSLQYANPIQNELKIESNNSIKAVTIYDMLGKSIYNANTIDATTTNINTQNWNSGLYLVAVTFSGNLTQQIKIIKE